MTDRTATTLFTGQIGVVPAISRITCTDTLAQITTAGYLQSYINQGNTFSDGDFVLISSTVGGASGLYRVALIGQTITLSANTVVFNSIVNADIAANAAIDFSKLAVLASGNILVGSVGGVATSVAVSGAITLSNTGVSTLSSGVIVNSNINSSAAIDFSKLAALPSAQILVGSSLNVATATAVTGDITIGNTGISAIAANAVTTSKIINSAVTLAKLAPGITPSHIIKFAGIIGNGGGSATITLNVAGVVVSDVVFAQVNTSTNIVTVQKVTPSTDTITVLLSGDPGASTLINYQALRAAS